MKDTLRAPAALCNRVGSILLESVLLLSLGILSVAMLLPWLRGADIARNEVEALRKMSRLRDVVLQRDTNAIAADPSWKALLAPPDGEGSLAWDSRLLDDEVLESKGYLFRLRATSEGTLAYAWPLRYGGTGNACFCLFRAGDLLETRNVRRRYNGLRKPPPDRAALLAVEKGGRYFGKDAQEWVKLDQ